MEHRYGHELGDQILVTGLGEYALDPAEPYPAGIGFWGFDPWGKV